MSAPDPKPLAGLPLGDPETWEKAGKALLAAAEGDDS